MTAEQQIPRATAGKICPLHKKDMAKVCHTCPWWEEVRGKHPQGEEIVSQWGCAIAWLPMMMVENSQMQRQTGAAVESLRNETVKRQDNLMRGMASLAAGQLPMLEHKPD